MDQNWVSKGSISPFARSLAYAVSAYLIKQQLSNSIAYRRSAQKSIDNGFTKESFEEKNEQYESSEEEEFEEIVQADFEFFDPKPDDFHGVKILLQTYLDNEEWNLSGFVDLILGQTTVGTVVKVEDDEDDGLFSVITALNLARYKDHKCIIQLKDFLLKMCHDKYVIGELRLLLGEEGQNVGLLVSQRVLNLPPQLLPPIYDGLFDEISWATEDEPTEELRNSFCFKYYILVSKIYKLKNENSKKRSSGSTDEEIIYIKQEDEIFHQLSLWSFIFPLHIHQVTTHEASIFLFSEYNVQINSNSAPLVYLVISLLPLFPS
ncbi:protein BCCIP homolog [Carica papaya]|uniref:protein BCCIP homolog n=1 Tax=Carica papaya TaxID=3649 RepID=UPI000B8CC6A9|nr:protein BCCIP homolog [Carica papaya]